MACQKCYTSYMQENRLDPPCIHENKSTSGDILDLGNKLDEIIGLLKLILEAKQTNVDVMGYQMIQQEPR
jgi:hypothetical protein